jgi:heme/copper-type cytochrome/quinol oxidase subunit 2
MLSPKLWCTSEVFLFIFVLFSLFLNYTEERRERERKKRKGKRFWRHTSTVENIWTR